MRKIPESITDPTVIATLTALNQQIIEKMNQVNVLRDAMKKKDLSASQLQSLKQISTEINELDQEWKKHL